MNDKQPEDFVPQFDEDENPLAAGEQGDEVAKASENILKPSKPKLVDNDEFVPYFEGEDLLVEESESGEEAEEAQDAVDDKQTVADEQYREESDSPDDEIADGPMLKVTPPSLLLDASAGRHEKKDDRVVRVYFPAESPEAPPAPPVDDIPKKLPLMEQPTEPEIDLEAHEEPEEQVEEVPEEKPVLLFESNHDIVIVPDEWEPLPAISETPSSISETEPMIPDPAAEPIIQEEIVTGGYKAHDTGDFPDLKREIQQANRPKIWQKLSPVFLFILSALGTILVLGSVLFAWLHFSGRLTPEVIEDIAWYELWSLVAFWENPAEGTAEDEATDEPTEESTSGELVEPTAIIADNDDDAEPTDDPGETTEPDSTDTPAETDEPDPTATPDEGDDNGETAEPDPLIAQGDAVMLYLPGGTYTRGDNNAYEVTLSAFYIDQYEVTNLQWQSCVEDDGCEEPEDTTYYEDDDYADHPVVNITWFDAVEYCEWRGSRLPTEAEWEMAARWNPETEDVTLYPWGDKWDPSALNYCDANCALANKDSSHQDGWAETSPVGTFNGGMSPAGLFDMSGNIAEWVADWYNEDYFASAVLDNPTGPASGTRRVARGGSWGLRDEDLLTSVFRSSFEPNAFGAGVGVRCAVFAEVVESP